MSHYEVPPGADPSEHRAETTAEHAELTYDTLRSTWHCPKCNAEVPPPQPLVIPNALYRSLAQAADVVKKSTEAALADGADHDPCPKCGGPSSFVHADLYSYSSELRTDLVVRHTPGAPPQLFRWSLAIGLTPEAWTDAYDASIARDAIVRSIAGHREQEEDAAGMARIQEALEKIPGDPALLKWFQWMHRVGALELSRAVSTAHVKAHPDDPVGHYWLAQVTVEEVAAGHKPKSEIDGAAKLLERAVELRPDYPDALIGLANVSRIRGRDDEAEKALRALLAKHPDHPEGNYTLGLVVLARDPAEALACFERGEKSVPKDADYPRSRARALIALGRHDEARAAISRAKELAPSDPRIDQVASQIMSGTQRQMTTIIRLVLAAVFLGIVAVIAWTVYSSMKGAAHPTPRPPAHAPAGKKR